MIQFGVLRTCKTETTNVGVTSMPHQHVLSPPYKRTTEQKLFWRNRITQAVVHAKQSKLHTIKRRTQTVQHRFNFFYYTNKLFKLEVNNGRTYIVPQENYC